MPRQCTCPPHKAHKSIGHIPHSQVAVSVLPASFTESRQLHRQVNDDQFGVSCIQIHPAFPEIQHLLHDHVNLP